MVECIAAIVASVVTRVVSLAANLLLQKAVSLAGVRDQIKELETELHLLQGFLKDADSKRKRGDARMESWICEIRSVAHDIEDVMDTIRYMDERRHQWGGCMGTISRYSHKHDDLSTLNKIDSKIKQIKTSIQIISDSRVRYGIADLGESSAVDESLQSVGQFSPQFDEEVDVTGFEDERKQLVKQLVNRDDRRLGVISIVGMGGLGKTTLAIKVYNDPAIRERFGTFAWVPVSQSYRVIEIVKDVMKKVMGIKKKKETTTDITVEDLEQMGEEEVREKLRDFLRDKKYLVVMDDVWTMDVWRQIHQVFPNVNNGSRILLTTRNAEVARHAEPRIPPHQLHLLNDTQSLELFCRKAFPANQDVPSELQPLAQKLAKRCGGLPLALVVLGGLMSRKDPSYDAWSRVAQSMNWESSGDGQECLSILGSSYHDLPYQLKPCFLYITAFPEDSIISVSKLVRLWIAEGFIPQQQGRTMEDTARDWLDELVQRCMIQVAERSVMSHGWVKSIRVHDMLRDFGLSEARKDGFLHVCSTDAVVSSHRVAFHNRINEEVAVSSPCLRTLLGFNLVALTSAGRFLNGLNLLRVLDLEGARDLKGLPKQMGKYMIHLRYLGLTKTGLKRLPSSIGHLLNLQTLDVRGTPILWLPKSFWKIRTLRHVYINVHMFLSAPIIGDHKNLQTLKITGGWIDVDVMGVIRSLGMSRFIKNWVTTSCSTEKAYERIFSESFGKSLEKMENTLLSLSPSVRLRRMFWTGLPADIFFAHARHLQRLRSLDLGGSFSQQQLPDSTQFPPNLTKLLLSGSYLKQDPMPVLEKLPNLRLLCQDCAFVGKSMSCSAGGFPRLQHLRLREPSGLEEWRVEVGAMPCLTHLTISYCLELKMLPEGLQHVTTLRKLKLSAMPRAFNDRIRNEDWYKVRHIPSVIFERERPYFERSNCSNSDRVVALLTEKLRYLIVKFLFHLQLVKTEH